MDRPSNKAVTASYQHHLAERFGQIMALRMEEALMISVLCHRWYNVTRVQPAPEVGIVETYLVLNYWEDSNHFWYGEVLYGSRVNFDRVIDVDGKTTMGLEETGQLIDTGVMAALSQKRIQQILKECDEWNAKVARIAASGEPKLLS